jgi:hypothetical protein
MSALSMNGNNGLSRTEIRDLFSKHAGEAEITTALALLREAGKVEVERVGTGGRPAETWKLQTRDQSDRSAERSEP